MSQHWSTTTTAFTVTRRDDDWLMIRHQRLGVTSWELPGGHVDPDETLEQTAARETFEETGVAVDVGSLLAICVHEWDERLERKIICFFDSAAISDATPHLSPEEPDIGEAAWTNPLALPPGSVSPFLHPLVEQQRLDWTDAPISYFMIHHRNPDGLWAPAPAIPGPSMQAAADGLPRRFLAPRAQVTGGSDTSPRPAADTTGVLGQRCGE